MAPKSRKLKRSRKPNNYHLTSGTSGGVNLPYLTYPLTGNDNRNFTGVIPERALQYASPSARTRAGEILQKTMKSAPLLGDSELKELNTFNNKSGVGYCEWNPNLGAEESCTLHWNDPMWENEKTPGSWKEGLQYIDNNVGQTGGTQCSRNCVVRRGCPTGFIENINGSCIFDKYNTQDYFKDRSLRSNDNSRFVYAGPGYREFDYQSLKDQAEEGNGNGNNANGGVDVGTDFVGGEYPIFGGAAESDSSSDTEDEDWN